MWWFRAAWQIVLLSGIFYLSERTVRAIGLPVPGALLGMALLFFALQYKIVRLEWVEDGADLLIRDLLLFFIPPAVGIMQYTNLFGAIGSKLVGAVAISILIVLWIISLCTVLVMRARRKGWKRL
ncbi:MAG: CidA/LrgA family protein [Negativicoccus succinicivorans]|uniref:CidA/LrgA family protein n=1 Tax=Negativicoccus succinicivorans TaxID=620903 RepID=UPI0026F2F09B|nr:CidA/LrgA family protein [Negativicoccus succinicivorans]MBS6028256.1 CidA/LrgA family protein [Negativicoccus succinicivorans]